MPSSPRTRDDLILSCVRLAAKIANHHIRRANSRRAHAEDIHATALEGLVRAAKGYDQTRGIPFPSYARRRIEGAVLDLFREQDHLSRHYRSVAKATGEEAWERPVSLENTENWEERFTDTGARPDDEVAGRRMVDMVDLAAKNLPPRTREVLRLYYAEDRTQKQIGVRLGLTETRICQIMRAAHEAIRAALGEPPAERSPQAPHSRQARAAATPAPPLQPGRRPRRPGGVSDETRDELRRSAEERRARRLAVRTG